MIVDIPEKVLEMWTLTIKRDKMTSHSSAAIVIVSSTEKYDF